MSARVDVERLYGVDPTEFTALRAALVAAAKKRGDLDAARSIGAARRPTTAAWVVNALVRADGTAKGRLEDLSSRLRAAHAAMDGAKIRESSGVQRALFDELVRTGFAAAGVARPSAALRDDVVGTLQAAVADPDVFARLGRLEKAERWSGFGEFGAVTAVGRPAATPRPAPEREPEPTPEPDPIDDAADLNSARRRVDLAAAEADAARTAHSDAADIAAERKTRLAKARRHHEKAEQALKEADDRFVVADRTAREAAARLAAATTEFEVADAELARLLDPPTAP